MKNLILPILILLLSLNASANDINVASKAEKVTIYHLGALVSRTSSIQLKKGINQLSFSNLSEKIILNSLKFKNKEITILNKTLIKKLTNEEYQQLLDKSIILQNQLALLESKYNETSFVNEVQDLEKMMLYYSKKIVTIKKDLRKVEEDIANAKSLDNIQLKNENAAILKVTLSIDKPLNHPLSMQYVVGGVGWSPSYEITVNNSNEEDIEIKYMAKIMSQTGENWNNVEVSLSSSFPLESPASIPKPEEAWVLEGSSTRRITDALKNKNDDQQMQQIERLEGVEYEQINIPSFLKKRTLNKSYSIKSNGTVFSFPIMTNKIPAKYYYYGYPSIDPQVYLVAEIIDWETYGYVDGIANMTYNNNDIGRSKVNFSEAQDTLVLAIGKDNSVFMLRQEISNKKYFKETIVSKKKKMTMAYEFILKNNNDFPIDFSLTEQVPISQSKSAEVIIEKNTNGKMNLETGEVIWQFNMTPGEAIEKQLIYQIETGSYFQLGKSKPLVRRLSSSPCPRI